ncbi:DNA repair photolyase [Gynuella sunshinyii YC6258]|uniref:DNA repair photolyase n=1 Tax=Gynuella sunshinyii YC6258 TaxID=1445510 RepID=A0A0C5VV34_9GAMM|nr:DNA repair photolyase [Gynuella sunshinyii YC6258]
MPGLWKKDTILFFYTVFGDQVTKSPVTTIKGRGTASTIPGRFARQISEMDESEELLRHPNTQLTYETAKSLITRNNSPDVPFSLSVNPYRGCEHGCIYCFARPTHAYLDMSPGLDFETRLIVKENAVELFAKELRKPGYDCQPIALGINTDAYQPVEKQLCLARGILQTALAYRQPISIVTKGGLILRDLDILSAMAEQQLVSVAVSVTTLDNGLKRAMEPRTASAEMRLKMIRELTAAGVPVTVLIAPVIPFINDHELEAIIAAVKTAGARQAAYIMLRLPYEVAPLFSEWLQQHFPDRAEHVLKRIADMRGGKLYDSRFGKRMTGEGIFADLINQRFHLAMKKHGLGSERVPGLDCSRFKVPPQEGDQLSLWDMTE